ncbi:hypothetical protein LEP1GSC016_2048 [Leptospira borgpetersenii serovar Hardjo-bovis str. Sponselee]|uniref:Uncharacterized protein n=6 Tax=Leptospira borgpetersenii TaxID=174 RepID=A0A0S2IME6_LEPBO|nr:hypothetical protein LBBP_00495 [Leptospira borgpetersenii serovar Ballum]EKP12313.1 hypothetical protein LEP1GSC128_4131 [Leptospira borgpetersenii str. 200801926]EKQ91212.1 hypothetical protein LEP1GSC101_1400 [Leptospira borgpetersenii str. UI 09149]EKR02087.1 hypothetical protein LEP1GSC121_0788 [Leptospira borgpetersenii serovar Castellonis str. 200801910]EMJ77238.1 hypothetical protein LEP1GSC016_2048 [Leptospira borgpetersenii serovar Hardjo-bovis str. Sponselee]EMK10039.1 hypothetic
MKDNSLIEFLKIESFLENYARFFFFQRVNSSLSERRHNSLTGSRF